MTKTQIDDVMFDARSEDSKLPLVSAVASVVSYTGSKEQNDHSPRNQSFSSGVHTVSTGVNVVLRS